MGRVIYSYVDDHIFRGKTLIQCLYVHIIYIRICQEAGIELKHTKTVLVDKALIGLGFLFDLNDNKRTIEVPDRKINKYLIDFEEFISEQYATAKQAQSVVGKMEHIQIVLWPLRCYLRHIYNQIPQYKDENQTIKITEKILHSVRTWIDILPKLKGIKIESILRIPKYFDYEIITDASDKGYGGIVGPLWFFDKFYPNEIDPNDNKNIRDRELYPIITILNYMGPILTNKTVKIRCDNQNAVKALINKDIRNEKSHELVVQICETAMEYKFRFYVYYIKGEKNEMADALSRLDITRFINATKIENRKINNKPIRYNRFKFDFGAGIVDAIPLSNFV